MCSDPNLWDYLQANRHQCLTSLKPYKVALVFHNAETSRISQTITLSSDLSDALEKMKGVYEQNPQMGDPSSLEPQITETTQNIGRLKGELAKYEVIAHYCVHDGSEYSICAFMRSVNIHFRFATDVALGSSGRRGIFQRHQQQHSTCVRKICI